MTIQATDSFDMSNTLEHVRMATPMRHAAAAHLHKAAYLADVLAFIAGGASTTSGRQRKHRVAVAR